MGKRKKFAPKQQRAVFRLVHRSQRDPLTGSEQPQHVLVPMNANAEEELQRIYRDEEERAAAQRFPPLGDEKESGDEDEMSFDYNPKDFEFGHLGLGGDGYDYSQHMMTAGQGDIFIPAPPNAVAYRKSNKEDKPRSFAEMDRIPANCFPSPYEEEIGLLELEAYDSRPYLDQDILHALEEVSEPEGAPTVDELEDDFVVKANQEGPPGSSDPEEKREEEFEEAEDDDYDDDDDYDEGPPELEDFGHEGAVPPTLPAQQKDLEEQFRSVLEMYDDDEIGELDPEDPRVQGTHAVDDFDRIIHEYREQKERYEDEFYDGDEAPNLLIAERLSSLNLPKEIIEMAVQTHDNTQHWDCQSITTLYSNTENHPALLDEPKQIKLSSKTGFPLGVLAKHHKERVGQRDEEEEEEEEEDDEDEKKNLGAKRPKKESAEEKRLRKQAVKNAKQEARARKKETKQEFSKEKTRQMSAQSKNPLNQQSQIRM